MSEEIVQLTLIDSSAITVEVYDLSNNSVEVLGSTQQIAVLDPHIELANYMAKAVYDADDDGLVDYAEVAGEVAWNDVTGKPTDFPPAEHTHDYEPEGAVAAHAANYAHPSESEKAALAGTAGIPSVSNKFVTNSDSRMSNARTPTAHTHPAADVTQSADRNFVSTAQMAAWDSKADPLSYTPEDSSNKNMPDGYAGLDQTGKVPSALLPETEVQRGNITIIVPTDEDKAAIDTGTLISGDCVVVMASSDTYRKEWFWNGVEYFLHIDDYDLDLLYGRKDYEIPSDLVTAPPADKQLLVFNASTGKFEPGIILYVQSTEPLNCPNGTIWINTATLE